MAYSTEGALWPMWSVTRSCCPCLLNTTHILIPTTVVPDLASPLFAQILGQLLHSLPTILWPEWILSLSLSLTTRTDSCHAESWPHSADASHWCLCELLSWVTDHVLWIIKAQRFQWHSCLSPCLARMPSPMAQSLALSPSRLLFLRISAQRLSPLWIHSLDFPSWLTSFS